MKKTYMQPRTEVVKVNAEQMICDSVMSISVNNYNSSTMEIADKEDEDFDFSDDLW